jgi:hypothetical protein
MKSLQSMSLIAINSLVAISMYVASPACAESALSYEGSVGNEGVGMTLYVSKGLGDLLAPGHVSGKYFYKKYLKDIKIDGDTDGKRGVTLYEYDASGKKVAIIRGNLPEKDPEATFGTEKLNGEIFLGTWTPNDGGSSLPVSLRMSGSTVASSTENPYHVAGISDAADFEQKVRRFKRAVINNDRRAVASMMHYPVVASIKDKPRKILNPAELLNNYDHIFTPKYVGQIKKSVPHNMFARYDGVMLGDSGEVWFDPEGKVKTLNN